MTGLVRYHPIWFQPGWLLWLGQGDENDECGGPIVNRYPNTIRKPSTTRNQHNQGVS